MTCYELKMSEFIPWYLEEKPRPENWEDIYNEYISLRENKSATYVLGLIKEIIFLKARYSIVIECCKMLNICFTHVLVDSAAELKATLRLYNYRQPFDLANEITFSRDIRAVLSLNKKTVTTWERKEKELKDFQDKHAGKGWTHKDFYVWAVTLSEYMKYRIDLDVITVAEWAALLNKYDKYCEIVNAQNTGKSYGKRK